MMESASAKAIHLCFVAGVIEIVLTLAGCSKPPDTSSAVGEQFKPGEVISENRSQESFLPGVSRKLLAPRNAVGGSLLKRVPGSESGLDFVHRWDPASIRERDLIATAFAGGGVALGDIDDDGLPEVFLTRPHHGARLYKNLGNLKFEDITAKVGIKDSLADHWSTGATFVDIQGDGRLDLYVCGYRSPNKLFINTGTGFSESAEQFGLDYDGASIMMSFADYDRDGDLDAYLLTNRLSGEPRPAGLEIQVVDGKVVVPEPYRDEVGAILKQDGSLYPYDAGQSDRMFRNDLASSANNGEDVKRCFTDVSELAGLSGHSQGLSATWWDYNADGWIDLYVANDFFGPDRLYRNNRNGTFSDVIGNAVPNTPWFSMGSDAGDLNGDGRLDFIASDMAATTHYNQKVNMGDMDAEGWFLEQGRPRQYMRNAVYVNTGTPRFLEVAQLTGLAATDWTWAVKIVDFDNDGKNDVFFSNGMTRDFFHADLRKQVREIRKRTGENRWSDFPPLKQRNRIFRNVGNLDFLDVSREWGINSDTVSFGAAIGDLDGDGDIDLVVNNFDDSVGLFRNESTRGNVIKVSLQGAESNSFAIGAEIRAKTSKVKHVRVLQPVRGFFGCDSTEMAIGLGDDAKLQELTIRWPNGDEQALSDLDAGYHYSISQSDDANPVKLPSRESTLFAARPMRKELRHIESMFDDFAVQPLLPNRLSSMGPAMAWGDLDGNGRPDCFLGGSAGHAAQLWLQSDKGELFRQRIPFFAEHEMCEDVDATMFDADADGDLDIYVVSGSVEADGAKEQYQDRLYLSVDNGLSVAPDGVLPDMSFSGGCVAAGDVDNDGDNDVFVGGRVTPGHYPQFPPSRLLINESLASTGQVKFVDATARFAPAIADAGMVTAAVWSDVDADQDLDLLVTTEYGPVRLYRNEAGKLVDATAKAALAKRLGWWNCIAAADVDADGDTDYAIGNFGLNTKYQATKERPQLLFSGDFDANGKLHCVEAHQSDHGALVPNRGRSCSSGAMPFIAQKFQSYHSFAVAELSEIYSPIKLQNAIRLEVNELSSGVLVNDGTGCFDFRPLPRLAQVAPCFGLAFLDANGDNNVDLYVSLNFFGPQRETGRMAGGVGQLLLGNGDASFTAVDPTRSGIVIPGDARHATAFDINGDGKDDLAVAVNNGRVRILQQQASQLRN